MCKFGFACMLLRCAGTLPSKWAAILFLTAIDLHHNKLSGAQYRSRVLCLKRRHNTCFASLHYSRTSQRLLLVLFGIAKAFLHILSL